ncbi:unnamed protein product [Blepharisma stoltei]|uniref:GTP-binding protein n=1 Tax=Blepharisma stoltei TaxID=1481888 RepID=A0AAU9IED7_9CILI|nr:unnamed protein product [Blepharisma stoltei]
MKAKDYDFIFKVIFIGDYGCGKSSILIRYCDKIYHEYAYTAGRFDFKFHTVKMLGKTIKLQIWDYNVDRRFNTSLPTQLRPKDGIFLVFDITNRKSFNSVNGWYETAKSSISSNTPIVLVGNKCDLESERQVSYDEAKELADNLNIVYIETSAKRNNNIEAVFNFLTLLMINS